MAEVEGRLALLRQHLDAADEEEVLPERRILGLELRVDAAREDLLRTGLVELRAAAAEIGRASCRERV